MNGVYFWRISSSSQPSLFSNKLCVTFEEFTYKSFFLCGVFWEFTISSACSKTDETHCFWLREFFDARRLTRSNVFAVDGQPLSETQSRRRLTISGSEDVRNKLRMVFSVILLFSICKQMFIVLPIWGVPRTLAWLRRTLWSLEECSSSSTRFEWISIIFWIKDMTWNMYALTKTHLVNIESKSDFTVYV